MRQAFLFFVFLISFSITLQLSAKSPKLYVVTRSTKNFRLDDKQFPCVGLFSTDDNGKNWKHYGWAYTKCFSAATQIVKGQRIFYLACGNGAQKSPDGGKSWILTSDWKSTECQKIVIDPSDPDIVYAATAYGIFKTTDGAQTWTEKNHGLVNTFTPSLVIDQNDHNLLFCATEAGIHRSRDGGEHWEPIGLLGLGIRTLIQNCHQPEIFAAGTENDGIFISQDHGKTWQKKNTNLIHTTIYALAFAPNDSKILYAGTFQGGIYKSENLGDSWKTVNDGLRVLDIHALIVSPGDRNTVYAGTLNDGVWMSKNAGESWQFIGLETSQVWDLLID